MHRDLSSPGDAAMSHTGLRAVEWLHRYSSSRQDLVRAFFQPALEAGTRYDRAAGFFRSSIYSLVGRSVASFVERGGRMRLLCSPDLAEQDIGAIGRGLAAKDAVGAAARRELERVLAHP